MYVIDIHSMAVACCMAYTALTLEAVPLRFSIHMYLYIRRKKFPLLYLWWHSYSYRIWYVHLKGDIAG